MKLILRNLFVALAVALLLSLTGVAQNDTTNNSTNRDMHKSDTSGAPLPKHSDNGMKSETSSGSLSSADQNFVKKAAEGGMAEVELGNLAKEKASSSEVKQFGERMVTDHSKANEQLKSIASEKGVTLPTTLDAKDQATKERLSKLSGEQFDRAYMNDMVKDHTKDVSEFKKESTSAKDPDIKSFASQTLPTLEDHLKEARQIAPKVKQETASKKTSGQ
jgi:putative membrane protein